MIVVDTNLIAYLLLNSDYSELAVRAYRLDPAWVAPILWRSEFSSVLAKYIWRKALTLAQAEQIMDDALQLVVSEYQVAPALVLKAVSESTCSAYDCEFVVLAQEMNLSLVTVDQQILSQFPALAISLQDYVERFVNESPNWDDKESK